MNKELMKMWANKLGLEDYNETLINEFFNLMVISKPDYTILFRKLSEIPDNLDSCLLYTSPSPRDKRQSRMPSSA